VHGRAEFYRRYALSDLYAEAGLARAFSPRLNASVAVGWTPDADFRPDWRLTAEAEFLALPGDGSMFPATWLLATSHYDVYQALEAWGLNPGLRLDWDPWAFTAHVNRVQEVGQEGLYGMTARLDGPLPVFPRHDPRFWLGYADVPETVALGGLLETVSTRTLFGGIGVAFAGDWMVLAGYARDDRENSYIRHVYNAGVSRKF
jgi:YaiO family outer membrane protein